MSELVNPSGGYSNSSALGYPNARNLRVKASGRTNPIQSERNSTPIQISRRNDKKDQSLKDLLFSNASNELEKDSIFSDNSSQKQEQAQGIKQKEDFDPTRLSDDEKKELRELKSKDLEVRRHEMAHMAAAGNLATEGIEFTFKKGPDGRNYAVEGKVNIDTSPGATPKETLRKATQIRSAALAANDPSNTDLKVATSAYLMEIEAKKELQKEQLNLETGNSSAVYSDLFGTKKVGVSDHTDARESHVTSSEHVKFCKSCLTKAYESLQPTESSSSLKLAKFA